MAEDTVTVEEEEEAGDEGYYDDLREPPAMNMANVTSVIRRKGFVAALSDEAMGPHVHLITILGVVVIIAFGVALMGLA